MAKLGLRINATQFLIFDDAADVAAVLSTFERAIVVEERWDKEYKEKKFYRERVTDNTWEFKVFDNDIENAAIYDPPVEVKEVTSED